MSVFVSSGDAGPPDARTRGAQPPARLRIKRLASSAYNVAVGGTSSPMAAIHRVFDTSVDSHQASARSYIRRRWMKALSSPVAAAAFQHVLVHALLQVASGVQQPTPAHQRPPCYLPDVSLAAAGHDGYLVIRNGSLY